MVREEERRIDGREDILLDLVTFDNRCSRNLTHEDVRGVARPSRRSSIGVQERPKPLRGSGRGQWSSAGQMAVGERLELRLANHLANLQKSA